MKILLYSEDEGGELKAVKKGSDQETEKWFDEIVTSRMLMFSVGERITRIRPAYVALYELCNDFDFVLGKTTIEKPLESKKKSPTSKEDQSDKLE